MQTKPCCALCFLEINKLRAHSWLMGLVWAVLLRSVDCFCWLSLHMPALWAIDVEVRLWDFIWAEVCFGTACSTAALYFYVGWFSAIAAIPCLFCWAFGRSEVCQGPWHPTVPRSTQTPPSEIQGLNSRYHLPIPHRKVLIISPR